ncbi:MAG: hypothetical protein C0459_07740 [Chitinophaga sp.]|jgi:hypothetical protein|nr:hypothetical protein [Chitinophaga sp.]
MKKFLAIAVLSSALLISLKTQAQVRIGIGLNLGYPRYYYPYGRIMVAPRVIVAAPPVVVAPQPPVVVDSTQQQAPVVVQTPVAAPVQVVPQVIVQDPYYYPYYAPNVIYVRPSFIRFGRNGHYPGYGGYYRRR